MATGGSARKPGRRWRDYSLISLLLALCTTLVLPADRYSILELNTGSSPLAGSETVLTMINLKNRPRLKLRAR